MGFSGGVITVKWKFSHLKGEVVTKAQKSDSSKIDDEWEQKWFACFYCMNASELIVTTAISTKKLISEGTDKKSEEALEHSQRDWQAARALQ